MDQWTECGGRNPVMKVASHFTQDKSFKQNVVRPMPHDSASLLESPIDKMEGFIHGPLSHGPSSKPYDMGALLRELEQQQPAVAIQTGPNVAQIAIREQAARKTWADEFLQGTEKNNAGALGLLPSTDNWTSEFLVQGPLPAAGPQHHYPEWDAQWDELTSHVGSRVAEPLGAHAVEAGLSKPDSDWDADWNNAIANVMINDTTIEGASNPLAETAEQIIERMSDPRFAQSQFLQFMHKVKRGEVTFDSQTEQVDQEGAEARSTLPYGNSNWADEFLGAVPKANVDNGVVNEPASSADQDWVKDFLSSEQSSSQQAPDMAEQWTKEFTEGASAEVFRADNPTSSTDDFWQQLQKDWEKAAEDNPGSLGWLKDTPSDLTATPNEYAFEAENPYTDDADPFNQGLQKRQQGDLPSAILFFEAALQKDPNHVKAWELLGLSLAENEQDPGAITAYKRCLALDPSNLVALMGLAVSYTNESYQLQACKALEDWIRNNPKYAHLTPPSERSGSGRDSLQLNLVSSLISGDTFNQVQALYLDAARLQPTSDMDPDVQTGLGVLLNLSSEFDKAGDCFRSALVVRPNDSLLWNRLGATLANGGQSEEAVQAYYKALELSPGFIRARYNLAVSCINLGAHREAAEHLVSALHLQSRRSKRVMSDNIWSTLRMVLNLMNRREFLSDVDARDLTRLLVEFGID